MSPGPVVTPNKDGFTPKVKDEGPVNSPLINSVDCRLQPLTMSLVAHVCRSLKNDEESPSTAGASTTALSVIPHFYSSYSMRCLKYYATPQNDFGMTPSGALHSLDSTDPESNPLNPAPQHRLKEARTLGRGPGICRSRHRLG